MKNKILIMLILIASLLICGCDDNQQTNNKKEEVAITYTESALDNVSLTINDLDITLDLSNNSYLKSLLLSIKLYKNTDNSNLGNRISKYVLSFGNYEFTIYDNKTICYIDNDNEYDYLTAENNEFDYLDNLFDGSSLDFNNYTEEETISVVNSKNDSKEISEKNEFLNNLKQVKCLKLSNIEHYQLGDLKYQISISNDIIKIYGEFVTINENLYVVTEGNFEFLNNIKFSSSSDWLPWI